MDKNNLRIFLISIVSMKFFVLCSSIVLELTALEYTQQRSLMFSRPAINAVYYLRIGVDVLHRYRVRIVPMHSLTRNLSVQFQSNPGTNGIEFTLHHVDN